MDQLDKHTAVVCKNYCSQACLECLKWLPAHTKFQIQFEFEIYIEFEMSLGNSRLTHTHASHNGFLEKRNIKLIKKFEDALRKKQRTNNEQVSEEGDKGGNPVMSSAACLPRNKLTSQKTTAWCMA